MRIDERLASAEPSFSFEFFPPKTDEGERNLGRALAELSRLEPTFVSVTYGAGGSTSQKRKTIDIESAIGAACFPEVHIHAESAESDLRYLKEKVDAGARFLITQLFFDNGAYWDFVARAREIGIDVPIVPGIMPITNYGQIRRITEMCGSVIPSHLVAELDVRSDDPRAVTDFGVAYATLQCADLLGKGAPGIHFYTLNRSPATRAILSALRAMAPWRGAVPV